MMVKCIESLSNGIRLITSEVTLNELGVENDSDNGKYSHVFIDFKDDDFRHFHNREPIDSNLRIILKEAISEYEGQENDTGK